MRWLAIAGATLMIAQSSATIAPGVHLFYTDTGGGGIACVSGQGTTLWMCE